MKVDILILIIVSSLLIGACTAIEEVASPPDEEVVMPGQHALTVTATADGWEAPAAIPAGWTRVTLTNESDGLRQAAFLRLEDGKTMDDVFAAIEAGMEGPAEWMVPYGGVSGVLPGDKTSVSFELAPGQYIVIDPVPTADGVPGMAKGYFMPLVVEESEVATVAPEADLNINMIDYAFEMDTKSFTPGQHTIQVSNSGPQEAHEVVLVHLDEGASVDDFLAAFAPGATAPPPGRFVAGTAAFAGITDNYMEVEFEEGATYGIICFTPAMAMEGQPHFMLGMVGQFEVN